jgi:hypothetical protein
MDPGFTMDMVKEQLWWLAWVLFVGILAGPTLPQQAPLGEGRAYRIKAAFLYHFSQFSTWPEAAFSGPQAPLRLCILGENPFGEALEQLRGKTVQNRPLEIVHLPAGSTAFSCHIVFMGHMPETVLKATLSQLQGRPVLTVGEQEAFLKQGGMIRLFEYKNRLQFEINVAALRRSGLQLSSRVIRLGHLYEEK